MAVNNIFELAMGTPAVQAMRQRLEKGGVLSLGGVDRAAQPFLSVLLRRMFPQRPVLAVMAGVKAQELFQQDVETWLNASADNDVTSPKPTGASVPRQPIPGSYYFPAWEVLPHEAKLPHADVISERLETLVALCNRSSPSPAAAPFIVANVVALLQRTFPPEEIPRRTRHLTRGDQINPLELMEWLERQGYEPEAQVTQKGEVSLRGGILDVFPLTSPWPVRLEFYGEEIESMRYFDPLTQISRERIESVMLPPGGELGLLREPLQQDTAALAREKPETPGFRNESEVEVAQGLSTILDYLPEDSLILLCQPEELAEHADAYESQIPEGDPFLAPWNQVLQQLHQSGQTITEVMEEPIPALEDVSETESPSGLSQEPAGLDGVPLDIQGLEGFRPLSERPADVAVSEAQRREFFSQLHRWIRQGYAVHLFCNNQGERQRFQEIWDEYGFGGMTSPDPSGRGVLSAHLGSHGRGFLFEAAKLVVVTDAEVFGRYKVQRPRRLRSAHAIAARSALNIDFTELEEGDLVVHLQYGIGRYLGLKELPPGQGRKLGATAAKASESGPECLVIEFAATHADQPPPKLYVPVTEAHLVSKYVGAGKARPPLNSLGGTRWAKAKEQAEKAVRDLAGELLSLQAARESQPGHSFAPDTPWQREFESAFLYEETPDQMRAILETKQDMERPKPMDRLICGDVGYGKTEVAIRGAFKAVMDGKQVAVLVPTTILAQQHYNTFRERMADYPVRIEQLSRFLTRREQRQVIQGLAEGSVDIVIGTHRLLQDDIAFKELGLVVIDEEQRFGVLHKEKLKLLRKLVDVLTMSATPIPRTLHLALTGARDMSTIETPPQDRLPIETIVASYDERLIRDAIQRELNRQGQVYLLHNRVADIQTLAARVQALVPAARVIVGHGQMESDELEEVMAKFVNGEADVLVCTTIIESGIDIPNANTIIVNRADRFGLSDLYQLRGRVGRYKHQAYAYLLLPRHAQLLSDVRKRISAIRQYSSLGSGFKIAMRDLEIRGAGNLLGPEQSGHITAVGFELYCQLLKQSVSALKGEKVKARVEVAMRLDFLASHPLESQPNQQRRGRGRSGTPELNISVPREVATYVDDPDMPDEAALNGSATGQKEAPESGLRAEAAYLPHDYIRDPRHRIEAYRKLAQIDDKESLSRLRAELSDRFGELPRPVELLLAVAEIKYIAGERGIAEIETRGPKLMLARSNDYITVKGKFPRLERRTAKSRLQEIKKMLLKL